MKPSLLALLPRRSPLLLPFFVPTFFTMLAWGVQDPVLPLFVRTFTDTYSLVGLVVAGHSLGMLAGSLPGGMLLRAFGRRRTLLAGLALAALGSLASGLAWSAGSLFVFRLIFGLGSSVFFVSSHAFITEEVPLNRRGQTMALYGGVFRLGGFLGPLAGGALAQAAGLRLPFWVVAGLYLAALVIILAYMPEKTYAAPAGGLSGRSSLHQIGQTAWRYRRIFGIVGSGQILAQVVRSSPRLVITLYGADVLGLEVGQVGFLISIGAVLDMFMFLAAGWLMDNYGRKYAIVPSFVLMGAGLCLVPLASSFWGLAFAALVIGFGNGIGSGTMLTLGADLAPPEERAEFLGVWRLIGDIGSALGPMAAGSVGEALALGPAALVMALSGFAAGAVFLFFVPETKK